MSELGQSLNSQSAHVHTQGGLERSSDNGFEFLSQWYSMKGKLVLITGASSGLGEHFARTMAAAGANIAITARQTIRLEKLVAELTAAGCSVTPVAMDVTDSASVKGAVQYLSDTVGVPDVLINNAGQSIVRPLLEQTEEDYDQIMDTNLKGAWLVATEVARHMVASGKAGNIINVASILAERVSGGIAPYTISKAGVKQFTKVMALELAKKNIRVNALLPGYVITNLNKDFLTGELGEKLRARIPSRQFCQLEDLEGPLLMLASQASQAMAGACVAVDRGHLVSGL